jgi:hypothetical protein
MFQNFHFFSDSLLLNGVRSFVVLVTCSCALIVMKWDKVVFVLLHSSLTDNSLPISYQKGISDIILIVSLLIPTVLAIITKIMVIREMKKMKKGLQQLTGKYEVSKIDDY